MRTQRFSPGFKDEAVRQIIAPLATQVLPCCLDGWINTIIDEGIRSVFVQIDDS